MNRRKTSFAAFFSISALVGLACVGDEPSTTANAGDAATPDATADVAASDGADGRDSISDAPSETSTDGGPIASVAGLALWLDGDSVIAAAGTKVPTWSDRSLNHNDAVQTVVANQPVISVGGGGVNGHNVVTFDGTASYLTIASASSLDLDTTGFLVEAVVRFPPASTADFGQSIYSRADGTSGDGVSLGVLHTSANGHPAQLFAQIDGSDEVSSAPGVAATVGHRIRTRWLPVTDGGGGGILAVQIDSAAELTQYVAAPPIFSGTGATGFVGHSSSTTLPQFFRGDIASIVVVRGLVDDAHVAAIESDLDGRYGL